MISLANVTFRYTDEPVLRDISMVVPEGDLWVVVGPTGSGKSTLLQTINGLVPRFTGGTLSGRVCIDGRDTADFAPRHMADVVGYVPQDPTAGFVTDTVEEELAYVMEQLAVPPNVMRKRVEETLDLLGLAGLRRRPLADLSGGEQQRVAIGSVFTAHPRVLVLDEPTSALDPTAAEEVLAAIVRIVHDLGVTVLLAEHRLERVVQYADGVVLMAADGTVTTGEPAAILPTADIAPPVIELSKVAGWDPAPLSVRDARRLAGGLRDRLATAARSETLPHRVSDRQSSLEASRVSVVHHPVVAVREVSLRLLPGEVVGLMGRNGSGKTSLLWALQGSGRRDSGTVSIGGHDPAELDPAAARRRVGLVPQTPTDLLYLETVEAECSQSDTDAGAAPGATRLLLEELLPGIPDGRHPRDLSEGQRLALVLAIQLVASPSVVLLDEPTRGLDYSAKRALVTMLKRIAEAGKAVVVSSHDVEFMAHVADRVVVMAEGEVVADGPTEEVVLASPAFAPQVAKILAPEPWLTVDQVSEALVAS